MCWIVAFVPEVLFMNRAATWPVLFDQVVPLPNQGRAVVETRRRERIANSMTENE